MTKKKTTTTTRKAAGKRTPATEPPRPLLLNEYKDVDDLIKRGTPDDRITAAVLCNYPDENLNVEHLTENELKGIVTTFTADEWATYGYNGAVHETAFYYVQELQRDARAFLTLGRILHALVLSHKTARQTADLLTDILKASSTAGTISTETAKTIRDGAPTLYGWNVAADGTVTPDFMQDLGGKTLKGLLDETSKEVRDAMEKTKETYTAFTHFRERTEPDITLTRKDVIYFETSLKRVLQVMLGYYAPSPEYQLYKPHFSEYETTYIQETADLAGVDMSKLPADVLEIDYFPAWYIMTVDQQKVSEKEDEIMKRFADNVHDYARIVSDATGLDKFEIGAFTYLRTK